jgi:hypothetical protein
VDVATVLFDLQPTPAEVSSDSWTPQPEPSDVDLVAEGVEGLIRTPVSLAGRALGALSRPGRSLEQAREAAEGLGEVVWAGLNPPTGAAGPAPGAERAPASRAELRRRHRYDSGAAHSRAATTPTSSRDTRTARAPTDARPATLARLYRHLSPRLVLPATPSRRLGVHPPRLSDTHLPVPHLPALYSRAAAPPEAPPASRLG